MEKIEPMKSCSLQVKFHDNIKTRVAQSSSTLFISINIGLVEWYGA